MTGVVDSVFRQITRLNSQTANLNERVRELETGLANLTIEVDNIVVNGGGASVNDVLNAIEDQGYLDISRRWQIGFEPGFGQDFLILDKLSNGGSRNNYYLFAAGEGPQEF